MIDIGAIGSNITNAAGAVGTVLKQDYDDAKVALRMNPVTDLTLQALNVDPDSAVYTKGFFNPEKNLKRSGAILNTALNVATIPVGGIAAKGAITGGKLATKTAKSGVIFAKTQKDLMKGTKVARQNWKSGNAFMKSTRPSDRIISGAYHKVGPKPGLRNALSNAQNKRAYINDFTEVLKKDRNVAARTFNKDYLATKRSVKNTIGKAWKYKKVTAAGALGGSLSKVPAASAYGKQYRRVYNGKK